MVNKEEQYLHIEYKPKTNDVNAAYAVRDVIIQLRQADPSVQILPYDDDTFLPSDVITHEDDVPENAEAIDKWVRSIETKRKKLCFFSSNSNNMLRLLENLCIRLVQKNKQLYHLHCLPRSSFVLPRVVLWNMPFLL